MKAISLWQPWASLWCSPRKIHETRDWSTEHRGWLVVHATKRFERDHPPELADILRKEFGATWYRDLPTGALIGAVDVVDCVVTLQFGSSYAYTDDYHCGDFSPGRFAFRRNAYVVLNTPIPYRGQQGRPFNIDEKTAEVIRELLPKREAA